ncbi:G-protein coupled receptor 52-like [Hydractinia symbiolongicarpus]|uniref:G-protein coupled receptor 52-like n=1 Tax=Hydractinia symbiolongicarpus TaxID=13093 RepID=UPI0025517244|nr:G-protein coupled receptor 52-like [Hydractinia symbiolongicarpus]
MDQNFTSVMMVIMSLMSIVIVVINVTCIYVILASTLLRHKTTTILIVSLLFFHLLQGLFVIPFYTAKKSSISNETAKKIICDGFRFSYMVTFYGVCVNVLLISVDRFLAVKLLTSYKLIVTDRRVKAVTLAVWLYMFLVCLIPFIDIQRTESNKTTACNYNQPREWTIFMLLCNTMLSYIVISYCYSYIYVKLSVSENKTRSSSSEPMTNQPEQIERLRDSVYSEDGSQRDDSCRKIIKLTFIIVIVYGVTWTPSIIYYLLVSISPFLFSQDYYNSTTESYVTFFVKFVSFFDAIGAPVIYCYFHTDFRHEFLTVWEKCVAWFSARSNEENGFVHEKTHPSKCLPDV